MSVLNQMLRDLEQRRGQSASTANPALRDLREPPQTGRSQSQRLLLPLLIGLVLLLSLALAWVLLTSDSDQRTQPQATTALPAQAATPPAEPQIQSLPAQEEVEPVPLAGPVSNHEAVIIEQPLTEVAPTPATQALPKPTADPKLATEPPRPVDAQEQTLAVEADTVRPTDLTEQPTSQSEAQTPQSSSSDTVTNTATEGVRRSDRDDPLARALSYWQSGRIQQAEQLLVQELEQRSDWHQVRLHYAQLLLQQQRSDAAVELLQAGLRIDPGALELRSLLARSQQSLGQIEAAIATLEAAPDLDQSNALLLLAALYQQQQRYDQAHQRYRQALELDASQGRGWAGLAISLEALGEHEQALEAWQQALARGDLPAGLRHYGRERLDLLGRR